MASEQDIATQIRTALAQHLKRDVSKVRPEDRLREDLGLDSLAMIELLFKIEEHFDLEIPNEDLSRITTVADVTAYVAEKIAGSAAPIPAAAAVPAPVPPIAAALPASAPVQPGPIRPPAVGARPVRPASSKSSSSTRPPAKVTSIKAAAKRRAAASGPKPPAAKKKGTRRG